MHVLYITARTNLVASSWLWVSNAFGCCCCCRCSWLLVLLIACSGASQLVLLAVSASGCEALGMFWRLLPCIFAQSMVDACVAIDVCQFVCLGE